MANLEKQIFDIIHGRERVNIPNNDIAKIMYYLNCVCHCIDYDDSDIDRFINYPNWSSLSDEEEQFVFFLALNLSPDLFIGKVFFPSDELCYDIYGKFYDIHDINHPKMVTRSLVITGRICEVKQIFAFKQTWLKEYYLDPMKKFAQKFSSRQQQTNRSCVIS
ncbi:unnamed protein product [Rotaria sp. Silwood2]|nr:unnamed protein product [Rotaria sp. Silwood2]